MPLVSSPDQLVLGDGLDDVTRPLRAVRERGQNERERRRSSSVASEVRVLPVHVEGGFLCVVLFGLVMLAALVVRVSAVLVARRGVLPGFRRPAHSRKQRGRTADGGVIFIVWQFRDRPPGGGPHGGSPERVRSK